MIMKKYVNMLAMDEQPGPMAVISIVIHTDLPYFSFPAIDSKSIIRALCEEFKFRIQPVIARRLRRAFKNLENIMN